MNKIDILKYSNLHKVFKPFYSGIGHVLVFHRVCNNSETIFHKNLQVTPEHLENVLKFFISNKIDIVTLDECYDRITTRSKPKRFVVFTFDDGYADNLTHALPVFEKYNAPLALFLATGFPDHRIAFWGYSLENLVLKHNKIEINEDGKPDTYNADTPNEKEETYFKIRQYLKMSNKENAISRLISVFGSDYEQHFDQSTRLMLSWNQLLRLSKHPLVTIGTHTSNHFVLSGLKENEVINEIEESVKVIETKTGKRVRYLAYPFGGKYDAGEREFRIAKRCNMKMAFTTNNGNLFKHHSQQLTSLPRIVLNENWTTSYLDLYINGLIPFINNLK